jgi:glycerol uptake facilitator-like aquaporin
VAAEAFAAFALVFAGCGAIVASARYGGALGTVGVALVFGLVIMVMLYATGHLSGAHINPAVTVAFTLTRHFPAREAVAYVGAQLVRGDCGDAAPPRRQAEPAGSPRRLRRASAPGAPSSTSSSSRPS